MYVCLSLVIQSIIYFYLSDIVTGSRQPLSQQPFNSESKLLFLFLQPTCVNETNKAPSKPQYKQERV